MGSLLSDGSPEDTGVPLVALWKWVSIVHWPTSSDCQHGQVSLCSFQEICPMKQLASDA